MITLRQIGAARLPGDIMSLRSDAQSRHRSEEVRAG
jgi:hypothetical protein